MPRAQGFQGAVTVAVVWFLSAKRLQRTVAAPTAYRLPPGKYRVRVDGREIYACRKKEIVISKRRMQSRSGEVTLSVATVQNHVLVTRREAGLLRVRGDHGPAARWKQSLA